MTANNTSESTDIQFRPATASDDDAKVFARFALLAAHDIFSHLFGKFGEALMRRLFLRDNNHFSHDKTTFIVVNDCVAGAISGYSHQQKQSQENRTTLLLIRILNWRMLRALIVDLFYTLYGIRMGNTRPSDYYVQIVAVDAEYRGQGLSYRLLQHAENTALLHNCTSLSLDVAVDNAVAIHTYEKFGFKIVSKSPRRRPVIYQMRKPL